MGIRQHFGSCRIRLLNIWKKYGDITLLSVFFLSAILSLWEWQALPIAAWIVFGYFLLKGILSFFPKEELVFSENFQKNIYFKVFVALLCLFPFFRGESVDISVLFLVFFCVGSFVWLTGKISFIGALGLLIAVVFFLVWEQQNFAETAAIYLYYLLVIGTVFELLEWRIARFFESDFSFLKKRGISFENPWIGGLVFVLYIMLLIIAWFLGFFDGASPLLLLAIFEAIVLFLAILGEEDRAFLRDVLTLVREWIKVVLLCWLLVWISLLSSSLVGYIGIFGLGFVVWVAAVVYGNILKKFAQTIRFWLVSFMSTLKEENEK